eukprot:1086293-Pelagomonas_calceolata.AAC.3
MPPCMPAYMQHVERLIRKALPGKAFVPPAGMPGNGGQVLDGSVSRSGEEGNAPVTSGVSPAAAALMQQDGPISSVLCRHMAFMLALPDLRRKPAGQSVHSIQQHQKSGGAPYHQSPSANSVLILMPEEVMAAIKECKDAYKRVRPCMCTPPEKHVLLPFQARQSLLGAHL